MNNFAQTIMGKQFFEGTMKKIGKDIGRIADALEALVKVQVENKEILEANKTTLAEIQETLNYRLK